MLQNHRSVCISDATDKLAFMGHFVFTKIPHQLFKEAIILFLFEGRVVNSNFFLNYLRKRNITDIFKFLFKWRRKLNSICDAEIDASLKISSQN